MARLNTPTLQRTMVSLTAIAVCTIALTGCGSSSSSGSVTITYETDAGTQTTTFAPGGVTCHEFGANGLSFPERPYNQLSVIDGATDRVSSWIYQGELVYFESETATISRAEANSIIVYDASASGRVAVAALDSEISGSDPDLSNAEWHDGTIKVRVTCENSTDRR
ncbi:hypothetical protein ACWKWP_05510 [Agromyces soli]